MTWTGAGEAEMLSGTWVSPGLFAALGVEPVLRRRMLPEEGAAGAPRVVLLSHEFWRDRFAAARDAVGRTIVLDGDAHTIIGVMPAGFRVPGEPADAVWPVLQLEPATFRAPFWLTLTARLAPGVTEARAASELASLRDAVKARYPDANANWSYSSTPLQAVLVRGHGRHHPGCSVRSRSCW